MPPMLRRLLRVSGVSAVAAFVYGLARSARRPAPPPPAGVASWPPLVAEPELEARSGPVRFTDAGPASAEAEERTWVDPDAQGGCPDSHPIKGNAQSKIFHIPGGMSYDRTKAERCYCSEADAQADGFRQAKR